MATSFQDRNSSRRLAVRKTRGLDGQFILNGIDYLEVAADLRTLMVYFIHPLPSALTTQKNSPVPQNGAALTAANIILEGGSRIRAVHAEFATAIDQVLTVRVNTPGDRSLYKLRLVSLSSQTEPPDGFDPQLSAIEFLFHVDEFSEFECQPNVVAEPDPPLPAPSIDYLAKDYASFRQLMLNRLTVTMPQWQERSPADVGVMLVELMAYAADHLSYYQDAIATEAYLETARKRVSVRRHARLLDYCLHNGRNARAWVSLQVKPEADGMTLIGASDVENRPGTQFLTRTQSHCLLTAAEFDAAINAGVPVFEAMHDLTLYVSQNQMEFYTWGSDRAFLPKNATQATLKDMGGRLGQQLRPGDVLIFEQIRGGSTGKFEDADPTQRHAVRLISVTAQEDHLTEEGIDANGSISAIQQVIQRQRLVEIEWALTDALPFPIAIAATIEGKVCRDMSVARGNVVLVDHGRTVHETLPPVSEAQHYQPRLNLSPLTQQGHNAAQHLLNASDRLISAHDTLRSLDLRDLRPSVWLSELDRPDSRWHPQPDLLVSDRFARDFVVELEEDGETYLRFGDNQLGRKPELGSRFKATYRIGNGTAGNVGAESIAHVYPVDESFRLTLSGIAAVRNPLPAEGGTEAESLDHVRLEAPQAFRDRQCAVTEADYAALARTYPGVQRALATRRWTGSGETIFITVDRANGSLIDDDFREKVLAFLAPFRLAGHALELDNPRFVPLDLALTVQVKPDYFRRDVRLQLQQTFSDQIQPNGQPGFFHPDRLTFAQPIYLSEVVNQAMQVSGVRSVKMTRFQRLWQTPQGELEAGQLTFARLEIPLLRNDPNAPEDGRLAFELQGGLKYA